MRVEIRCPARAKQMAMHGALSAMTALTALTAWGCSAGGDDASALGNLGESTFLYSCTSASDAACAGSAFVPGSSPSAFPAAFAVGSRIHLSVAPDSNVGNPVIRPVSDEYLAVSPAAANVFTVLKAGFGGVFVESTVDSSFVDYTLLRLVTVDALQIGDDTLLPLTTPGPFATDQTLVLTALPTADNVPVAGALDFEWTVADPTVVSMSEANPTARVTLSGLKAGSTKVTLTGAGKTVSTTVTVTP